MYLQDCKLTSVNLNELLEEYNLELLNEDEMIKFINYLELYKAQDIVESFYDNIDFFIFNYDGQNAHVRSIEQVEEDLIEYYKIFKAKG